MSTIDGYTDQELLELWEERAAVGEFDGGLSRQQSERRATHEIYRSLSRGSRPLPGWLKAKMQRCGE